MCSVIIGQQPYWSILLSTPQTSFEVEQEGREKWWRIIYSKAGYKIAGNMSGNALWMNAVVSHSIFELCSCGGQYNSKK